MHRFAIVVFLMVLFGAVASSFSATDYALRFDGVDDFVSIPDHPSLDLTTGITIEFWVNVLAVSQSDPHVHFVSKNEGQGVGDRAYAMQTDGAFIPYIFLGQVCLGQPQINSLTTSNWYHLAGTFDGQYRKYYVNGVLQYALACDPGSQLYPNDLPLQLGKLSNYGFFLNGDLDEVRIWRVALDEQTIGNRYNKRLISEEIADSNLVAYYDFNEGNGSVVGDKSHYGNHGVFQGDLQWVESTAPLARSPKTLNVPSEYSTIQAGIDVAIDGDTVLVAPGVYSGLGNSNLTTMGKQILLMSTHGPDSTTILLAHEGYDEERGFDLNSNEDSNTVIIGFGITSPENTWSVTPGGAIRLTNSSPKFVNCRISRQMNMSGPGAVKTEYSTAIFQGCAFTRNVAGNSAAKVLPMDPAIGGNGGAVNAQFSDLSFRGCLFQWNNTDEGSGGAIRAQNSLLQFDSCEFISNSASGHDNQGFGGAVHGDGAFRDCIFKYNDAMYSGGAVCGDASFERCLFVGNYSYYTGVEGGGAFYGNGSVTNCTFVGNTADLGSAVYSAGSVNISNSLFIGNYDKESEAFPERADPCVAGPATISCTDIFGNSTGDWVGDLAGMDGINGNFAANPRFCDSASGDFSISNTSPCAPANNSCDILVGALSVSCIDNPIHVPTQFATIQAALDAASSGDTIYLSAGTYNGPGNVDLNALGKSVTLIGAGRDSTIIDCSNDGQNHRGIWIRNGEASFKLQSLSIRNGAIPDTPAGAYGAAILVESETQLTVDDCVLSCESGGAISFPSYGSFMCRSSSIDGGGGAGLSAWSRTIVLEEVRIANSSAGFQGAADSMYFLNCQFALNYVGASFLASSPVLVNCRFDSNLAMGAEFRSCVPNISSSSFADNAGPGAWLTEFGFNTKVQSSSFTGNTGSGIQLHGQSDPESISIKNCHFQGNIGQRGGAIECWYDIATVSVDSCTFFGNRSPFASTFYLWDRASFSISRSLLAYNSQGSLIVNGHEDATTTFFCSNIFGNTGGDWVGDIADQFGVNGNISVNPLFCDTANGDFHIAAESPCAPANNSCNQQIGAFGVACSVKPGVTAVSMENEALTNVLSPTPTFQWAVSQPVPSPQDSFLIAVGTDTDWQFAEKWNPAPFASSDTFVTYDGSALQDGQTYYLRLRVHNTLAWSDWYQTSFRMNSVPASPILRTPTDLAVVGSTPILWVTNGTDAESDPLTYEFAGFHDTDCVSGPAINLTGVASGGDSTGGQIVDPLAENCRYWWRARAFDGYEYSAWTSYAQFMVNGTPEAPATPTLDYPPLPDNKPIFTLLPTLSWQVSHDPDPGDTVRYKLELSDRANFSFALVRDSLLDVNLPLVDSLVFGTHYYWRVTARDKSGLSAMSGVKEFWTWKLGDVNHSHSTDLSDLSLLIAYLTQTPRPDISPKMVADLTGDCKIDLSDLSTMVAFMTTTGVVLQVGCE